MEMDMLCRSAYQHGTMCRDLERHWRNRGKGKDDGAGPLHTRGMPMASRSGLALWWTFRKRGSARLCARFAREIFGFAPACCQGGASESYVKSRSWKSRPPRLRFGIAVNLQPILGPSPLLCAPVEAPPRCRNRSSRTGFEFHIARPVIHSESPPGCDCDPRRTRPTSLFRPWLCSWVDLNAFVLRLYTTFPWRSYEAIGCQNIMGNIDGTIGSPGSCP